MPCASLTLARVGVLAAINHVDATGRNGNGDFDDPTRQPVQWYSLRT